MENDEFEPVDEPQTTADEASKEDDQNTEQDKDFQFNDWALI